MIKYLLREKRILSPNFAIRYIEANNISDLFWYVAQEEVDPFLFQYAVILPFPVTADKKFVAVLNWRNFVPSDAD